MIHRKIRRILAILFLLLALTVFPNINYAEASEWSWSTDFIWKIVAYNTYIAFSQTIYCDQIGYDEIPENHYVFFYNLTMDGVMFDGWWWITSQNANVTVNNFFYANTTLKLTLTGNTGDSYNVTFYVGDYGTPTEVKKNGAVVQEGWSVSNNAITLQGTFQSSDTWELTWYFPPDPPTLVSPEDNAFYQPSSEVTFDWNFSDPNEGDYQTAYAFQLASDINFTNIVINVGKTSSTTTSASITLPSDTGIYYWRVKVWDSQDLESEWSANRSIRVGVGGIYDVHAAYFEDDGSFQGNSSVTVVFVNGTEATYIVNGSRHFEFSNEVLCFRWNITEGNERVLYVTDYSGNLTFFIPEGSYSIYYFNIQDYIGLLQTGNAYLESYRFVDGSYNQSMLIERKLVQDYVSEVPLIMNVGATYLLKLKIGNTVYSFGYFTAGSDTTQTLALQDITFTSNTLLAYRYVRVEASRSSDGTEITVNYQDTLENTTSVELEIQYSNGTVAYSDSSTGYLIQFYWGSADNETDYIVYVTVTHKSLGTLTYKKVLPYSPALNPPFDLSPLGTFPIANNQVIPLAIVVFVAAVFSTLTAPLGIFLTVLTAIVLRYIGWLNVTWSILAFAMSMALIYAIAVLKRRMR